MEPDDPYLKHITRVRAGRPCPGCDAHHPMTTAPFALPRGDVWGEPVRSGKSSGVFTTTCTSCGYMMFWSVGTLPAAGPR